MDLIHLILNNGYNPYLIRGYGGLGYNPQLHKYNSIKGGMINDDEDDNEKAITRLLKEVSEMEMLPAIKKTSEISNQRQVVKLKEIPSYIDELLNEINKEKQISEPTTQIIDTINYNETPTIKYGIMSDVDDIEEEYKNNSGVKLMDTINELHREIVESKIKHQIHPLDNEIEKLEEQKINVNKEWVKEINNNKKLKDKISAKKASDEDKITYENRDKYIVELGNQIKDIEAKINDLYKQINDIKTKAGFYLSNGQKAELFQIEYADFFSPVKKFTKDNTKIVSNEEIIKNRLMPNEEVEIEWLKLKYKKNMDEIIRIEKSIETKKKLREEKTNFLTILDRLPDNARKIEFLDDENKNIVDKIDSIKRTNKDIYINEFLYPWQTLPLDNSSKKCQYELKNFTPAPSKNYDGITINPKILKYIKEKQNLGLTPKQIEEQAKKDKIKIPTIPITRSKLTGYNGNTNFNRSERMVYARNPDNGKIQPDKLIITGLIPKENNKLDDGKLEIDISEGNYIQFVFDIITNNARVFYSPLEDDNAILTDEGRIMFDERIYEIQKKEGAGACYKVPITRMYFLPPRTIEEEIQKMLEEIEKIKNMH